MFIEEKLGIWPDEVGLTTLVLVMLALKGMDIYNETNKKDLARYQQELSQDTEDGGVGGNLYSRVVSQELLQRMP
jgi:hypothetical protein